MMFCEIEYYLQEQLKSSLEKNLSLYLPVRAWLVIALEVLMYNELEWPKCLSYELLLIYDGSIMLLSLLIRLRKYLLFISDAWNAIFHLLTRLSHSFFLPMFQNDLLENNRMELNDLVSISTTLWRDQLH